MDADVEFYKHILDNLGDGIYFTDRQRRITYWNLGAERITGYQAENVIGTCCSDNLLMHVDDAGTILCHDMCPLAHTMADGQPREAEVYLHHLDGHRVPVTVRATPIYENGVIVGAVETFRDHTTRIAALQKIEELQREVYLDRLTSVGNRRYSELILDQSQHELVSHRVPFGILYIDIDHFKNVNDTFGHRIGDQVLKMVAQTLASNVRPFDFVGRWGGEEFIVVAVNVDQTGLNAIAEKLRSLVERSRLDVGGAEIQVTISVGSVLANPTIPMDELVERADQLLYHSKNSGRNRITGATDQPTWLP